MTRPLQAHHALIPLRGVELVGSLWPENNIIIIKNEVYMKRGAISDEERACDLSRA